MSHKTAKCPFSYLLTVKGRKGNDALIKTQTLNAHYTMIILVFAQLLTGITSAANSRRESQIFRTSVSKLNCCTIVQIRTKNKTALNTYEE